MDIPPDLRFEDRAGCFFSTALLCPRWRKPYSARWAKSQSENRTGCFLAQVPVPVLVQVPLPLPEPPWREMDSVR